MDTMQKLMNRMRDSRFTGVGIDAGLDPLVVNTRAEFVARVLGEAVSFQVENDTDSDLGPGELDDELQLAIEELREAREVAPLAAYALAERLVDWLVSAGYTDRDEMPRYVTRPRHTRNAGPRA